VTVHLPDVDWQPAYAEHGSIRALAAHLTVTCGQPVRYGLVRCRLLAAGVPLKPPGCAASRKIPAPVDLAVVYARVRTLAAVARHYQVSALTARRWLVETGLPINPQGWAGMLNRR